MQKISKKVGYAKSGTVVEEGKRGKGEGWQASKWKKWKMRWRTTLLQCLFFQTPLPLKTLSPEGVTAGLKAKWGEEAKEGWRMMRVRLWMKKEVLGVDLEFKSKMKVDRRNPSTTKVLGSCQWMGIVKTKHHQGSKLLPMESRMTTKRGRYHTSRN